MKLPSIQSALDLIGFGILGAVVGPIALIVVFLGIDDCGPADSQSLTSNNLPLAAIPIVLPSSP